MDRNHARINELREKLIELQENYKISLERLKKALEIQESFIGNIMVSLWKDYYVEYKRLGGTDEELTRRA